MNNVEVVFINDGLLFDNGYKLESYHEQDCCENHYLSFDDLTMDDFKGLKFNLEDENFFRRIEDYGIELLPSNGHSVKIPGYCSNNGYYSSDLSLVIIDERGKYIKTFDITECQNY